MGRDDICFTLDLALLRQSMQTQESLVSEVGGIGEGSGSIKKKRKKTFVAVSPRVGGRGSVRGGI